MLNEHSLKEFYEHVFPVELITQWLSYSASDKSDSVKSDPRGSSSGLGVAAEGYLARREFCFTLLGDVFTRFRSYGSASELRTELIRTFPEKIDVGAVYNVRPSQKQGTENVVPLERELVFDIDMSDYDNVRSCCSGKSICEHCWRWMSSAAQVLRMVLEEDFGFQYILPVFSGRRGIHVWVCDKSARALHDDERAALVGYLTVVAPKTLRGAVVGELANHRPIHPTIRRVLSSVLENAFLELFILSGGDNPNNAQHSPAAAKVLYDALCAVLKQGRRDALVRFTQQIPFEQGNVLDWSTVLKALGTEQEARDVVWGAVLLLMYPRLDEGVSTHRNHLLKLPFCVHPGTGSLCCPLEWEHVADFNPTTEAPKLTEMLLDRHLDDKWKAPLVTMLARMREDPQQQTS